jgi:hypothetical protein
MPSKVYKEYKSYYFRETPSKIFDKKIPFIPYSEKEVYRSFEIIPYRPPETFRSSSTIFLTEEKKKPETLIIPITRTTIVSPPKKTVKKSYKCVTFTVNEMNDY